ncbi:uncharacterized protein LOC116256596 [Nymphaea colorata]|nr:uncharacterized protein LOC116256596 [Nymphaea colorata]
MGSPSLGFRAPMRKLCPNLDRECTLDTVLEVPVPDEMLASRPNCWHSMKAWRRSRRRDRRPSSSSSSPILGRRNSELQLLLRVVGTPLIHVPLHVGQARIRSLKDQPLESGMARYIVEQYVAAIGGRTALSSVKSMYAIGKVRMMTSDLPEGSEVVRSGRSGAAPRDGEGGGRTATSAEIGGFVLWQKGLDLWCIELVISGLKISAGSDGKVAWKQTPWHRSRASRGPPPPLRRSLQGLDPRSVASLFAKSECTGEKTINGEDCFILKLEAEAPTLRARSSNNVEMIRHTVWGYFSQRTGLLVRFEDSHLLRINGKGDRECTNWETTMVSQIQGYRQVDGILIAHEGRTEVSLFRFGESSTYCTRTRMEETWIIEEIEFNIWGLSIECFLPPSDLQKEQDVADAAVQGPGSKAGSPRDVFAIRNEETDSTDEEEGES